MVVIGVDPAFRKGGFWAAFADLEERTVQFRSFRDVLLWDRFLFSQDAPFHAVVAVENSNLQDLNFDMSGNRPTVARKGRNVGTNQAVSELTVRSARDRYGVDAVMNISPREKGKKYDDFYFHASLKGDNMRPIGYTGLQDQRDAYKLAHLALSKYRLRKAAVNGWPY